MKWVLYLCLLMLFPNNTQTTPAKPVNPVYYGGSQGDTPYAALPLEDGGMIVCGSTFSTDGDFNMASRFIKNTYAFATRFDAQWNVQWQVIHSRFDMSNAFEAILPQADGSFALAFSSMDRNEDAHALVHIDPDGNVIKVVNLDIQGYTPCFPDGENLILWQYGEAVELPYDPNLPWDRVSHIPVLICVDANGQELWRNEYPELLEATEGNVKATPEGYVITAARNYSVGMQYVSSIAMLARLDDHGNLLWHTELDNVWLSQAFDAVQGYEGGIVVAGDIAFEENDRKAAITWLDRDGNIERQHLYPIGEYTPFMSILDNERGYLLMGSTACAKYASVVQVDHEGNLLWSDQIKTPAIEPFQMQQLYRTKDGYCFVAQAHVDEIDDFNNSDLVMIPFASR